MPIGTPRRNDSQEAVFGGLLVSEERPVVQLQFPYNVNSELIITELTGGGTASVVDNVLELNTTAASNSRALAFSKQPAPYNAGQGQTVKFSLRLSTPKVGTEQLMGVGDMSDGFMLGTIDGDFVVRRREGGQKETRTVTITSGASGSGNITITLDGTPVLIAVTAGDSIGEVVTKIVNTDFTAVNSGWKAVSHGSGVHFINLDNGAKNGTFSLVDTDTTSVAGTFVRDIEGVEPNDTIIKQEDFNQNKAAWLDVTKGNVYRIRYQWLGYGKILFEVENPDLGVFVPMHIISYTNQNLTPSIKNPTLPICMTVANTTNDTEMILGTSSAAIFSEGPIHQNEVLHNEDVEGISVGTTETPLITIHNRVTFAGTVNRVLVKLEMLSLVTDGNKGVFFTLSRNSPLIGPTTMTHHDENISVISFDSSSTGIILTDPIIATGLGKVDSQILILDDVVDIYIPPGDYITISGHTAVSSNADVAVSVTWKELY
jgi:hypothetical protein